MGNTILLADKSVTIQKIVQLTFADEDFQITCVNDGQSALEAIPRIRPDVILADIGLPLKNGYDLCQSLRKDPALGAFANTPVILLAGIYETMDEDRARMVEEKVKEVGANALLSKPFDPQLLTSKVKELMAQPAPAAAPESGVFAEVPAPAEEEIYGLPAASPEEFHVAPPPDDTEKTMMLPGPPGFGSSMFAEAPPFEEEVTPVPRQPVDADAVKPQGETVFEEQELEALPEELPGPGLPEMESPEVKEESPAFPGFEEPMIEPPPKDVSAAPPPAEEAKPSVVSGFDDPFGDVFGEQAGPAAWAPSATSEEESPFGLPEPPPAPPAPPEPEQPSMEEAFNAPEVLEEPPLTMEESDREQMEEMMVSSAAPPEFGEDTWSRARAIAEQEQPVEELFESAEPEEPQPAFEEAVELQPDITSSGIKAPEVVMPEPPPELELEPAAPVETQAPPPAPSAALGQVADITDELVERIARRVVELMSDRVIAEIVWQVVPDLAEKMIRRELEKLHAGSE